MRVLLAGSTGVIGREVARQLVDAGHSVTGLARSGADLSADLLDREAMLRAVDGLEFDAIIHQATALKRPPLIAAHMTTTNRLRTEGTSTLLAVARETGASKFVTASVFYGYGFGDHGDVPLDETDAFGAQPEPVQLAVLSNEQQVRAAGGTALRYGFVYGTGGAPVVVAGWQGVLPVIHVVDAASAAVSALSHAKRGQAYNIADDSAVSWAELQQASAVAAGSPSPRALPKWLVQAVAPFAAEMIGSTSMRLSTAKARRELRWRPQYPSFAEGLAVQVEVAQPA
jgi:nucleoside-diphosphate-sugar epimerase